MGGWWSPVFPVAGPVVTAGWSPAPPADLLRLRLGWLVRQGGAGAGASGASCAIARVVVTRPSSSRAMMTAGVRSFIRVLLPDMWVLARLRALAADECGLGFSGPAPPR